MSWLETLRQTFLDWPSMLAVLPTLLMVGLKNTLILAIASTIIGVVIGLVLAVMGIAHARWLKVPARIYTDIFRGLPAIVTILLIGQGFARIGRILFGPSPFPLGILALSLIAGAYIGEIFRSGIQSVERGQLEACRALGMSYAKGMRLIVIPQGVRRVLPALVNQFIGNIKDSSLVYFLGLLPSERELFRVGRYRQSVAFAARRHFLPADHRSAHACRQLHRSAPAHGQAAEPACERTGRSG
jgi:polar amino acid transport system permease protein